MRGRTILPIVVAAMAAIASGCSSGDEETPAACLGGADVFLTALEAAPAEVRLEDDTSISDCVTSGQEGAELATVGEAVVGAATKLNVSALRDPDGPEAVRLGYLVGAIQEGVGDTGGIHADLVRRLDAAARFSQEGLLPAEFERAFGEGYSAGQDSG